MKNNNNYQPLIGFRDFSRRVAHEGHVLLENKNHVLPLINQKIAVFGRIQTNYYKSGTGSGGLVNVTDVPSFIDAFLENPRLDINQEVLKRYVNWEKENPFNAGNGMWASEPWSQEEMEFLDSDIEKLKREGEVAVVIIGRTAGEDRDNFYGKGSYLLSDKEYELIKNVKSIYDKVIVILNVGNVIDLNFVDELSIDALLFAWHGGQDGARATADIISGFISPSGKLPATIAKDLSVYPATADFGNKKEVKYLEGIYVGYRFYETFYPNLIKYPFGFGLTYTSFEINLLKTSLTDKEINLKLEVKNIGKVSAKEVIQVYLNKVSNKHGRPKYELKAFTKTKLLKPQEIQIVSLTLKIDDFAIYDELRSSYLLESGDYHILYGTSSKDHKLALTYQLEEEQLVLKLSENLRPVKRFKELQANFINNKYEQYYQDVLLRTKKLGSNTNNNTSRLIKINHTNNSLYDVYNNNLTIDEFVENLSFEDLKTIIYGEGMSSPKVTSGTASAFGGVTKSLLDKGIPLVCCADGPSGIRMDSGMLATSLPNGTSIASTFNLDLVNDLYQLLGHEMLGYDINIILGPGMNIQRHPLNGRNFEYFSEDPLLTGKMASSAIKGLHQAGVFGAIKHFAANNQESGRFVSDSVASERTLREIYLKPFEIAVKEASASVIMTSYNPINGIWAASNHDLNTNILRNEWGFKGIVMTDWWAQMNNDNDAPSKENLASMIKSGNDLYMVVPDALKALNNIGVSVSDNTLSIYELQQSAKNILEFIMRTPSFKNKYNINLNNQKKLNYPFINENIQTTFNETFNKDLEPHFDLIESNDSITYALINKDEPTLYVYGTKEKQVVNEFNTIIDKIDHEKHLYKLPKTNWESLVLDLNKYVYKSSSASHDWHNINKDDIYIFNVDNESFGKYIIELSIKTDLPTLQQLPLSIYLNNENKRTITTNGTDGKEIMINAQVIFDTSTKYLGFKFHKTGITVKKIKLIKHG